MGMEDNLFRRKIDKSKLNRPLIRSQQFRLNNPRFHIQPESTVTNSFSGANALSPMNYPTNPPYPGVMRLVLNEEGTMTTTIVCSSVNNVTEPSNDDPRCVCFRESRLITCQNQQCDWSGFGRTRAFCPSHNNVIYLYDLPQCPKCRGPLQEVTNRCADEDEDL